MRRKIRKNLFLMTIFCGYLFSMGVCVSNANAASQAEIVVAYPSFYQHEDPVNMKAYGAHQYYEYLFDGLVNLGPQGQYPGLATSWKVSEDGLSIDFILRKGVKFHNGEPFTAKDVKFTFEALMGPESRHAYRSGYQKGIKNIEIVDDYHVRFHMKEVWLEFLSASRFSLQPIVPKSYFEKVGAKIFAEKPVGTGPFKLIETKRGEWNKFEAFNDYWEGAPEVKRVITKLVAEPMTRYAMLKRGEADIISGVTGPLLDKIKDDQTLRLVVSKYVGTSVMMFDKESNPEFRDKRVRLAMSYAIDRDTIDNKILKDIAEVGRCHFTPGTFGHDSSIPGDPYDPVKAKQLLKEAGIKEGYEFDYVLHTESFTSLPDTPRVLEAIANYWEAVGLRPRRIKVETGAWLSMARGGKFKGVGYAPSSNPDDGGVLLMNYYITGCQWLNWIRNPVYDEYYRRQSHATSIEKRKSILQEWSRLEYKEHEAIPMFWAHAAFGIGARIKSLQPSLGCANHLNVKSVKLH